ncbi:MAG: hypothetical protein V4739_01240 [Pseudomonadota bacterium]
MNEALRQTQYQVFAEHRLHFSRLFYQVVAFILFAVLAAWAVMAWAAVPLGGVALVLGSVLGLTSFIVHRLRCQEESYASLMRGLEQPPMLPSPLPTRWSARVLVVACLACTGLALILGGLWRGWAA